MKSIERVTGMIVLGVLLHTAIVQFGAFKRTEVVVGGNIEIIRLTAGLTTVINGKLETVSTNSPKQKGRNVLRQQKPRMNGPRGSERRVGRPQLPKQSLRGRYDSE